MVSYSTYACLTRYYDNTILYNCARTRVYVIQTEILVKGFTKDGESKIK